MCFPYNFGQIAVLFTQYFKKLRSTYMLMLILDQFSDDESLEIILSATRWRQILRKGMGETIVDVLHWSGKMEAIRPNYLLIF